MEEEGRKGGRRILDSSKCEASSSHLKTLAIFSEKGEGEYFVSK